MSHEHDTECNAIGSPSSKLRLAFVVSVMFCPNLPGTNMFPSHLARLKAQTPQAKRSKSHFDSLLNALRNAKELAVELKRSASTGWPLWWMGDVVLEYCARPDGVSILDAYQNDSVGAFRYKQHSRSDCFQYSHFGANPPSEVEYSTFKIPFVSVLCGPRPFVLCISIWVWLLQCAHLKISSGLPTPDVGTTLSLGATLHAASLLLSPTPAPSACTLPMAKSMLASVLSSTSLR